jgi:hypothetical protein
MIKSHAFLYIYFNILLWNPNSDQTLLYTWLSLSTCWFFMNHVCLHSRIKKNWTVIYCMFGFLCIDKEATDILCGTDVLLYWWFRTVLHAWPSLHVYWSCQLLLWPLWQYSGSWVYTMFKTYWAVQWAYFSSPTFYLFSFSFSSSFMSFFFVVERTKILWGCHFRRSDYS